MWQPNTSHTIELDNNFIPQPIFPLDHSKYPPVPFFPNNNTPFNYQKKHYHLKRVFKHQLCIHCNDPNIDIAPNHHTCDKCKSPMNAYCGVPIDREGDGQRR
eukprot:TRINITY_DN1879_c0_g1_i4.p1 TRINITY_DN1879_c0_g1~~TRINITY_DN1879_c0_g1_i4.p1  ORF type:complete len:102 (+),score=12.39 TRINITY_DN1879_c0_g1_i4:344-649(+)